jgi:AbiV family abortive infection protein
MYTQSSKECLLNAEQQIEDAKSLIEKGSFGIAQSLGVTAFEEIGKAVILELANLGFVSRRVIKMAMHDHRPKRVMLIGIEQSKLLLGENLASQASQYILDKNRLEKVMGETRKDMGFGEEKTKRILCESKP